FLECCIAQDGPRRLRTAVSQQVLASERELVEAEPVRNYVGVTLVSPSRLRSTESTQGAGRRTIGVDGVRIDRDIFDVVRPGCGKASLWCDPRSDIGIGTAVPNNLALTCDDFSIPGHSALNLKGAGMARDHKELLFHGQRDLYRAAHQ